MCMAGGNTWLFFFKEPCTTPSHTHKRACYFGCLKGVSKSVQVLLNGKGSSYGTDFNNSEIASPVLPPTIHIHKHQHLCT